VLLEAVPPPVEELPTVYDDGEVDPVADETFADEPASASVEPEVAAVELAEVVPDAAEVAPEEIIAEAAPAGQDEDPADEQPDDDGSRPA
jgi:hypothetical protein